MPGYIYLATNPVMPGLTKIGFTESVLSERFTALQSTGVPVPFQLFAAFRVDDPRSCEKALHAQLVDVRVAENREFFRIEAKDALPRISAIVFANTAAEGHSQSSQISPFHDLSDDEKHVLAAFALAPSVQRPNDWRWLRRVFGMPELDARHLFHSLRTKGYLSERRNAGESLYDLAPRGVSFGLQARDDPDTQHFDAAFYHQQI